MIPFNLLLLPSLVLFLPGSPWKSCSLLSVQDSDSAKLLPPHAVWPVFFSVVTSLVTVEDDEGNSDCSVVSNRCPESFDFVK